MLDRLIRAFLVVGGVSVACAWTWPGAFPEADPVAVPVRSHTPNVYRAVVAWYYVAPGVAVFLAGQFLISTSRIWFARMGVRVGLRSRLPRWPLSPSADGPAIVVGEVHHPVKAIESPAPAWLTIPERGLYTGVAIVGAVGSGKTSACMHPFARQLLSWHATNPERRAAALVLEVKGNFCHDIRRMLTERGALGGRRAGAVWPTAAGLSERFSEPCSFARRLQDIESDTGYDTRRRVPGGVLAGVSQTAVYDTC